MPRVMKGPYGGPERDDGIADEDRRHHDAELLAAVATVLRLVATLALVTAVFWAWSLPHGYILSLALAALIVYVLTPAPS